MLDGKNHPYVPAHVNAIQQVLLNVCPRIVLGRGGGRKENPARDALIPAANAAAAPGRAAARAGPGSLPRWVRAALPGLARLREAAHGSEARQGQRVLFSADIPPNSAGADLPRAVWVSRAEVKEGGGRNCVSGWNSAAKELKVGGYFFELLQKSLDWG